MDLKTHDLAGTVKQLATRLGWQCAVDPDDWRRATVISIGGYPIGTLSDLSAPIYPPGTPPHVAFYLAVDDADRRAEAAAAQGAQVLVPPFDAGDQGRIATLIDPFGAVVSLWQRTPGHGWRHPAGLRNAPYRMVLTCPDPDRTAHFYRDALGAPLHHADLRLSAAVASPPQWQLALSSDHNASASTDEGITFSMESRFTPS